MSEPKSYGPIGRDEDCLCCAQARTADHVGGPTGTDHRVAWAIAACLSTIEAVEREGVDGAIKSLCGPCREAFDYVVRQCRS